VTASPVANPPSQHAAAFLAAGRVARLATADAEGRPHIVPVCYVYTGHRIFIALDDKPKTVAPTRLKRVRNILANPRVSLLVDTYTEDWSRLGYVLVSGIAALEQAGTPHHLEAVSLLREKYPQYRRMRIEMQPVIAITPTDYHEWQASGDWGTADTHPTRAHLDFDSLARGRHVVRRFKAAEVPRALVERSLEAAKWAPSPHGAQPWRFVVLTNPGLKETLADAMAGEWKRTLEMDGESADVVEGRLRASRARILGSPVAIIACLYLQDLDNYPDPARQEAEVTMAVQSLGAAIQNILLCAYSLGLDTGWMCAPLFVPHTVREALNLPPAFIPHALIQMGYALQDPPRKEKKGLGELVVWLE
jgi:PPOX class probable F420-dependent enzyme